MTPAPLLFLDTETTGLRRPYLHHGRRIWEIGGVRVEPDGTEYPLHLFIRIEELLLTELLPPDIFFSMPPSSPGTPTPGIEGTWYDHLPEMVREGLKIGGFHERHPQRGGSLDTGARLCDERSAAATLMDGLWLRERPIIVGAVPNFDELGLFDLLHRTGYIGSDDMPWNYHLVCAETLAAGALGWAPPWDTEELTKALGVDITRFRRHCAVDDALWARALYRAALELSRRRS
jgi:hypothetical protein